MGLGSFFSGIFEAIISVLPGDPFISYINEFSSFMSPYLANINYFLPFSLCIKVLIAWLTAVTLWYLYRAIASWLHLVG